MQTNNKYKQCQCATCKAARLIAEIAIANPNTIIDDILTQVLIRVDKILEDKAKEEADRVNELINKAIGNTEE